MGRVEGRDWPPDPVKQGGWRPATKTGLEPANQLGQAPEPAARREPGRGARIG